MIDRRKYDNQNTRDIVVQTQAELQAHTQADALFHQDITDSLDKLDKKVEEVSAKLDEKFNKLNTRQLLAAGFISAFMFFLNYPQVVKLFITSPAEASLAK